MRKTLIVIPARLHSSRIPRKVLADINGKPMIQVVYEHVVEANLEAEIIVAVDHPEVKEVVDGFGQSMMTDNCVNGTERCARVCNEFGYTNGTWVINVQGDNAGLNPKALVKLHDNLIYSHDSIRSIYCMHEDITPEEMHDDGIIKVVTNLNDEAVWFTRQPVPLADKHSGIYGYTAAFLHQYVKWGEGRFEQAERLEQMRVIENGGTISCKKLDFSSGLSINTPKDLEFIRERNAA